MSVLWSVLAGLQCGLLYSDSSPGAGRLHRNLSEVVPLAYPLPPMRATSCTLLLLYRAPASVQRPVFVLPPGLAHKIVLVTWRPPTSDDLYDISTYFYRTTFLWISEFGDEGENYYSFQNGSNKLKLINATEAANVFKPKRLDRLPNYKQKKFTIAAKNYTIYCQVSKQDVHGHFEWWSGFELRFVYQICKILGLKLVISKMLHWDSYYSNGTVKTAGLQGEVKNWKVDGALGGIWYRPQMVSEVDMLAPWEQGCFRYLVPRPTEVVIDWTLFIEVFRIWLWVLVISLTVFVAAVLVLFTKWSPNPNVHKANTSLIPVLAGESLGSALFITSTLLIQVPQVRRDWCGPQVPVLFAWVWTVLILAAAYGGSLNAELVHPELEDKANTIQEFLERGFTHGAPSLPKDDAKLFDDDDESEEWLEWQYKRFRLEKSLQDRIERMKTRKYVVPGESIDNVFYFLEEPIPPNEVTQLYEVADNCHQSFYSGPIFPYGSPYSEAINKVASRMRAAGIHTESTRLLSNSRLRSFVPNTVFTPTDSLRKNFVPLSIGNLSAIFLVLLAGHILASCLFLAEMYLGHKCLHSDRAETQ